MRRYLFLLTPFLLAPLLSSCEFALAEPPVVKRWISTLGGVGLELTRRGERFSGKVYWLTRDGERYRDLLSNGLHDREKNTMVFPLQLRRGGSIKKLRKGTQQYVEFDLLQFDRDVLVGVWRTGSNPPEYDHTFFPYEGP